MPRRRREKTPPILKLSELLAIGVKYFRPDSTTFMEFNDGTRMWWEYYNDDSSGYLNMSSLTFWCEKDGVTHWVEDDVTSPTGIHKGPPRKESNFYWRDPRDVPPRPAPGNPRRPRSP